MTDVATVTARLNRRMQPAREFTGSEEAALRYELDMTASLIADDAAAYREPYTPWIDEYRVLRVMYNRQLQLINEQQKAGAR